MKVRNFEHFIAELGTLSKRQRKEVLTLLNQVSQQEQVIEEIERAAANLGCPRCRSTQCRLHGHADGWQRFRYRLLDATTVRTAAARAGVHKNTSFRWRRRFPTLPKTDRPLQLHGITEADEMYLLESDKGARHLQRPAQARRPREQAGHIERTGLHFGGP